MAVGRATDRWDCPDCRSRLEAAIDQPANADSAHRLVCRACGKVFRLRKLSAAEAVGSIGSRNGQTTFESANGTSRPVDDAEQVIAEPSENGAIEIVGPWALIFRDLGMKGIEWAFRAGTVGVTLITILGGGFVPVVRGWLDNEVSDWKGVVDRLGGAWPTVAPRDPDADLGPVLERGNACRMFDLIAEVARRVGGRQPGQVRISALPCCAVVACRKQRVLVIGLPLLDVLSIAELRAVLTHELTHLARGDAAGLARAERFTLGLTQALDRSGRTSTRGGGGPLRLWAHVCQRVAEPLNAPIALGREARADRTAAALTGGQTTAEALIKVAIVQPIFRELLDHYEVIRDSASPNVFAFFRTFWNQLPEPFVEDMRCRLLSESSAALDGHHPPLATRLRMVTKFPDQHHPRIERALAVTLLADPDALEEILHNRLFGTAVAVEPSVFHEAGRE